LCQKRTCNFWHKIKILKKGIFGLKKFWSCDKSCKFFFPTRSKVLIMVFLALEKLLLYCQILIKVLIYCQKLSKIIKTFNLLPKIALELLPNLRENLYLLFRSCDIWSTDQIPSRAGVIYKANWLRQLTFHLW